MKLIELEPSFLKTSEKSHSRIEDILQADGILFLCPKCFLENKGSIGTHSIICWQPHVDPNKSPKPGRWKFLGTGFIDLTLQATSSSISLTSGCKAHFFITAGEIIMC